MVLPGLAHDIVLGMDFLGVHNPTIDFAGRDMLFANGFRVASECVQSGATGDCSGSANV